MSTCNPSLTTDWIPTWSLEDELSKALFYSLSVSAVPRVSEDQPYGESEVQSCGAER